ncbi:MAG: tyrosine-type recombinase/integrase [Alphaproteobacteria bacterium]
MYQLVKRKDRANWEIQWYENGKAKYTSTGFKDEASAQAFFKAFSEIKSQGEQITVDEVLNKYRRELSRKSVSMTRTDSIIRHLMFFDGMSVYDVKANIFAYRNQRRNEKVQDITIDRELSVLLAAINWAKDDDVQLLKSDVPSFKLKTEKRKRTVYLEKDDTKKLLEGLLSEPLHLRIAVLLAITTAARKGAILSLTKDKVLWSSDKIDYRAAEDGKKRKGRSVVKIPEVIKPLLRQACEQSQSGFIVEKNGKPCRDIHSEFEALRKRVGLPNITFHDLRRTWATHAAINGVPMQEIRDQLAHSSVTITEEHYAHLSPDHRAKADNFTQGYSLSLLS